LAWKNMEVPTPTTMEEIITVYSDEFRRRVR
jgi:hypothetical protein